jgi:hypothetical protein|tara:strand:- start:3426 stop:3983 length:558 start_codon:yes stop_codon:yes gene_type:complete
MSEDKTKEELVATIRQAINEVVQKKDAMRVKSLSRYNPDKVADILYLYSIGNSQTRLIRKYGYDRNTIVSILTDYADYFGKFKEMSGQIAARNYMHMSSLEEDLIEQVRGRMETGELEVTFRDLKELSIAKSNSIREALTARGEATNITEDRKVYTQEDYEDTLKAAKDRLKKIKGDVIDIDGDN